MNRLIIIGNGFDLAHGMRTSYYHFICNYIREVCQIALEKIKYEDELMYVEKVSSVNQIKIHEEIDIKTLFYLGSPLLPDHTEFVSKTFKIPGYLNDYSKPFIVNFKSTFTEKIFTQCHESKWVDIENEYYNSLKFILNEIKGTKQSELMKLNWSMKFLKFKIEEYMSKQKRPGHIREYENILKEKILITDLALDYIKSNENPKMNLILNFNYTDTIYNYTDDSRIKVNFIHGKTHDNANPIIFGFGDELDKNYKQIEEEKEKGFLDYMKSFGYFKTSNYHNLVRFISSDLYQIYILGHSCGLSDRTMLNMIFEHDNCKSIKIFYYRDKDNNNHNELTQEISRHFNNKEKMRERIVSEDKSLAMPQYTE